MAENPSEKVGCMGSRFDAETALREAYRAWTPFCQPIMGTAAALRGHERARRAAEAQLVRAATLLGWHLNRDWILSGEATHDPDGDPQIGDAGDRYEITFFDEAVNARRVFGRTIDLDQARQWTTLLNSIGGAHPQLHDRAPATSTVPTAELRQQTEPQNNGCASPQSPPEENR